MNYDVSITSIVDNFWLLVPVLLALLVFILAFVKKAKDLYWRVFFMLFVTLLLLNPVVVKEVREYLQDKILVLVDNSASMNIANRAELANRVVEELPAKIKDKEIVFINSSDNNLKNSNLFTDLLSSIALQPLNRVAGTVFVTDGQIHDVPKNFDALDAVLPVNTVVVGSKREFDYKLNIVQAPKYALVDNNIKVKLRLDLEGKRNSADFTTTVKVLKDGDPFTVKSLAVGSEEEFEFSIDHAGQNIFEFLIDEQEGEISAINNNAAVIVNGVRDRLKVLLVSGKPHMGERAWRNLLRSDPAVDLVHFTILRSPRSFDLTPSNKLSLIAFPVAELFDRKINEFDLIIFDKYVHYGMLRDRYFTNIANYVRSGGSFLFEMASDRLEPAIFDSEIANILPVSTHISEQEILKDRYIPSFTKEGEYHAITSGLDLSGLAIKKWASQVSLRQTKGINLLNGIANNPLLIVDEVEKGRVALLASDNIWLWSKYPSSKGLYIELQRKLAHWLMKEPELDEGYIKVTREGAQFNIKQRYSADAESIMNVKYPSGQIEEIELVKEGAWMEASLEADYNGIYKFYNNKGKALAIIGASESEEFSSLIATSNKMQKAATKTAGNVVWYNGASSLNAAKLKFKSKSAYEIIGVDKIGLFSPWLYIMLLISSFIYLWRKESK